MRTIKFTKMHGLGNDFMMINAFDAPVSLSEEEIKYLSERNFGVGFDQLLIVEKPTLPDVLFKYRIFNSNGTEVEQCGNGARCFARFVVDEGLTTETSFKVETKRGIIIPCIEDDGQVTVDMGKPEFDPSKFKFKKPLALPDNNEGIYTLQVDNELNLESSISFAVVSMGNPHVIIDVPAVDQAPVLKLGEWFQKQIIEFPEGVNVEFIEHLNEHTLKLRVYERGFDTVELSETKACGTGACAAAAWGIKRGVLKEFVTVIMKGGKLLIKWEGGDSHLFMTGPAITVFKGECYIPYSLANGK